MIPHLSADDGQARQHLEKRPAAARCRHQPGVFIEHGRVLALAAPVRGVHPVDGVVEIHEGFALPGVKELSAVGGEPVIGGLGGLGVVRSTVFQLGVYEDFFNPGAAGTGGGVRPPFLPLFLLFGLGALVFLDRPDLVAQGGEGQTGFAKVFLYELQVSGLLQWRQLRHLAQNRFQRTVPLFLGHVRGQPRDPELKRHLRLGDEAFEILSGVPGGEEIVDIDLGRGQKFFRFPDFFFRPSDKALGELPRTHRRVQAETLLELLAGVFPTLVEGKDHQPGLNLVSGEDGRCFERTVQAGFGYFVVLADVDGLDAAQARQQPFPVGFPDTDRDRRHRCESVFHQGDAIGDAFGDDQPFRAGEQTILVEEIPVVDTGGDVFFGSVVMDRELLVLAMLPVGIGRPRRFASDHEDHAAAAPVRENDPSFEERDKAVLAGRDKRSRGGELAQTEAVFLAGQRGDDALTIFRAGTIVRETDQQLLDGLVFDPVLGAKPLKRLR